MATESEEIDYDNNNNKRKLNQINMFILKISHELKFKKQLQGWKVEAWMSFTVKYNLHVVGLQSRQVTNVFAQQLERIANFSTDHNI